MLLCYGYNRPVQEVRIVFIGIDHGTTGIRFADTEGRWFEITRQQARDMTKDQILQAMLSAFSVTAPDIELIAVTYSMGDGISKITPDRKSQRQRCYQPGRSRSPHRRRHQRI